MPNPDKLCIHPYVLSFFFFVRVDRIRFLPSIVLVHVSFSIGIESISWLEIVLRFNEWKIQVLRSFKDFFFLFHFKYIRDFIIVKVSTN